MTGNNSTPTFYIDKELKVYGTAFITNTVVTDEAGFIALIIRSNVEVDNMYTLVHNAKGELVCRFEDDVFVNTIITKLTAHRENYPNLPTNLTGFDAWYITHEPNPALAEREAKHARLLAGGN